MVELLHRNPAALERGTLFPQSGWLCANPPRCPYGAWSNHYARQANQHRTSRHGDASVVRGANASRRRAAPRYENRIWFFHQGRSRGADRPARNARGTRLVLENIGIRSGRRVAAYRQRQASDDRSHHWIVAGRIVARRRWLAAGAHPGQPCGPSNGLVFQGAFLSGPRSAGLTGTRGVNRNPSVLRHSSWYRQRIQAAAFWMLPAFHLEIPGPGDTVESAN